MVDPSPSRGSVVLAGLDTNKLLLALGAYASLAYLLGYAYLWTYLDVFGATFLISQVPTVEVLFGSATVLVPALTFMAAIYLEEKAKPTEAGMLRLAFASAPLIISSIIGDIVLGTRLTDSARSAVFGFVGMSAVASAAACGELALAAWHKSESASFVRRTAAFALYTFLVCPAVIGLSEGFHKRAHRLRDERLQCRL